MKDVRPAVGALAIVAIVCALVMYVNTDGSDIVLESNEVLAAQKEQAKAKLDQLNNLKALVQKAAKDPTPANVKAAMDAQNALQHPAAAPAEVMAEAAPAAPAKAAGAPSNTELKAQKAQQEDRIGHLDDLKQIIHKAMTDPTPANIEAAKAAAMELQGGPPAAPQPAVAAAPAPEPKPEAKKEKEDHTEIGGASDDALEQLKAAVMAAMKDPSPENVERVKQLQSGDLSAKDYKKPEIPKGVNPLQAPEPQAAPAPVEDDGLDDYGKPKEVLLILDIDDLGKIEVHQGDSSKTLAEKFIQDNDLDDDALGQLQPVIAQQMKDHKLPDVAA
jgi:hypothetical protein